MPVRGVFFLLRASWLPIKFLISDSYRSGLLTWVRHPDRAHQLDGTTQMDRYPELFAAIRDCFRGKDGVRILSFGCSTGEEVATISISRGNAASRNSITTPFRAPRAGVISSN